MKRRLAAVLAFLLLTGPALATDSPVDLTKATQGWIYFQRQGETIDAHNRNLAACLELAKRFRAPSRNGDGSVLGQVVASTWSSIEGDRTAAVNLENCMVSRGWHVVRLPEAEGEAMSRLPPAALRERLAGLVGAPAGPAQIARLFNNDTAHVQSILFKMPGTFNPTNLSLRALPQDAAPEPIPAAMAFQVSGRSARQTYYADIVPPAPEQALILVRMINGISNGRAMGFRRIDPGPTPPGRAGLSFIAQPTTRAPELAGFYVTPGRWALASFGQLNAVHFCQGAPAFDVKAGEVVFAGSFDMAAPVYQPDMNPQLVQQHVGTRLGHRSATYTNGNVIPCGGIGFFYAYEIDGMPFEEGYRWGSRARLPV